ncbi:hypothetical protein KJ840_01480 [Patescibacteria group bacterium]|nr:hypothetical protein [Patescibacteria group bacterium]
MEELKKSLVKYSEEDFNLFIPKTMLKLSTSQIKTIQFVFWFCYIVEKNLDDMLKLAFRNMEKIEGKTPQEMIEFIKTTYKIDFKKVDPTNPSHDPDALTFNDRIDIVEKIMGISVHTKFLRKVKSLRNNLSHGRIYSLEYEGNSLLNNQVKAKLLEDYIQQAINFDKMESLGGVVNNFSEEQKKSVNKKYEKWFKDNVE